MQEIDYKSKEFLISRLQAKGWQDISTTSQYQYYDLEATSPNNKRVRFELKQRNIPSTLYRDSVMEVYKLNNFIKDQGQYDRAYLVTFFTDCWAVSDILQPKDIQEYLAPATTSFDNRNVVNKRFVKYDLHQTHLYEDNTLI